jgi:protein-disulfide isomerase
LEHPEIIPEAVERLQAKRVANSIGESRKAIETPYAGAWEGAANGDVTLVEFFDYACGYCRASLTDLAKLVAEDKGLKVVYRELPILSDESADAARVSLLAAEKGQYMPYHRALYAGGKVTRETILAAAAKVGIDRQAAEAAMANKKYDAEIQSNIALAQQLRATGTPTFVVGDQVLNGAVGYDALKQAVASARAK